MNQKVQQDLEQRAQEIEAFLAKMQQVSGIQKPVNPEYIKYLMRHGVPQIDWDEISPELLNAINGRQTSQSPSRTTETDPHQT